MGFWGRGLDVQLTDLELQDALVTTIMNKWMCGWEFNSLHMGREIYHKDK